MIYWIDEVKLDLVKQYVYKREYEEAASLLTVIDYKKLQNQMAYHYYASIIAYYGMNSQECLKHIEYIEDNFQEIPVRYRALSYLMEEDIKTWKKGDLGDISRKMEEVSRKLTTLRAGKKTQDLQKEILNDLDRLIEQKTKEAADAASFKEEKDKKKQEQENKAKNNDISDPAKESNLPDGNADGVVDKKRLQELASNWGNLPPKEQEKAIIGLTRNMPAKYREAIEIYIKEIGRKHK